MSSDFKLFTLFGRWFKAILKSASSLRVKYHHILHYRSTNRMLDRFYYNVITCNLLVGIISQQMWAGGAHHYQQAAEAGPQAWNITNVKEGVGGWGGGE